jgi:hypothetical protein
MDQAQAVAAILMWTGHADAAIFHQEIPYKALLEGSTADNLIRADQLTLAEYYRANGLPIWVTFDVTNGINRAEESAQLVELGRSIAEPEIQAIYRDYVKTFVSLVRPDHVGLAAETNLIRLAAPDNVYAALVAMTHAAAAELRDANPSLPLYVTVQVDTAWGGLTGTGTYVGVERDFADFPFVTMLGLSSYPYLAGYSDPADIPLDYYQRLRGGRDIPVFVAEGGWSSEGPGGPALQAAYIARQGELLARADAVAWFQLTFTDLDLSTWPGLPPDSILPLFATNGLVDADLNPKPALAAWDALLAKARR